MTFAFQDWKAGDRPPVGFDIADCVRDGWSRQEVHAMMKDAVCDVLPGFPDQKPPAQALPKAVPQSPVDQLANMPRVMDLPEGGEVGIAQHFAAALEHLCGGRVVRADGAFWAWGPTDWRELPEQRLRLALHQYNGSTIQGKTPIKLGKKMIDGALFEAGTILGDPSFFRDPTVGLNAANGVVRIYSDGSIATNDHNPEDRFRFTIPAPFVVADDMRPPETSMLHTLLHGAFLGDPDAGDKIDLIGEILGSAAFGMATRLPQPKAFVFHGETASNGKSTIASLLECLLPADAVSHITLSAFEDERRVVHLAGRAANVADELSASAIGGETLKSCITGDTIEGRDLYKSAVTFTPRALHLYTTNVLPRFNGGLDRGLQRRLVVVRFNRSIPAGEVIADIADRIRSDELDLLLRFAIAGAVRLTLNRAYTIPASSREALQGWLLLDPVNEWIESRAEFVQQQPPEGWSATSKLFADFRSWAIDQGHQERFLPPVNTFSQRLKTVPGVTIKRLSHGSVATGLILRGAGIRSPLDSAW